MNRWSLRARGVVLPDIPGRIRVPLEKVWRILWGSLFYVYLTVGIRTDMPYITKDSQNHIYHLMSPEINK